MTGGRCPGEWNVWAETRDTTQLPVMHSTAPYSKEISSPNVNHAHAGQTYGSPTSLWGHSPPGETMSTHPSICRPHSRLIKASHSTTAPSRSKLIHSKFMHLSDLQRVKAKARSSQQAEVSSHISNLHGETPPWNADSTPLRGDFTI